MARGGAGGFGATSRAIADLARNPGFGKSLMADARSRLLSANKQGLQGAIQRRAGEGSARGLFDSGLTQQGFQGIEADYQGKYLDALQNLEMQNQQQALQGLGLASSHFLGARGLSQQAKIAADQLALQQKLGMGQLGLGRDNAAMNRAWQEFQMNLLAQQFSPTQGSGSMYQPNYAGMANDFYGGGPRGGGGRAF